MRFTRTDGESRILVEPKLLPAARLDVAASAHGQVRAVGLARFFPAHTIHAEHSTAVVAGNHCRLRQTDHYHVHRVTAPLDPLIEDRAAKQALRDLLADPTDSRRVEAFQCEMRRLATPPPSQDLNQDSVRIRPSAHTSIASCDYVQVGDRNRMNVTAQYVIEESQLPIINMFAEDQALVRSFAQAVADPDAGKAPFLQDMRRMSRGVAELELIGHATDLETQDARLASLFGFATVENVTAVMIGSHNELVTDMRVHRPGLSRGDLHDDLKELHREFEDAFAAPDRDTALDRDALQSEAASDLARASVFSLELHLRTRAALTRIDLAEQVVDPHADGVEQRDEREIGLWW